MWHPLTLRCLILPRVSRLHPCCSRLLRCALAFLRTVLQHKSRPLSLWNFCVALNYEEEHLNCNCISPWPCLHWCHSHDAFAWNVGYRNSLTVSPVLLRLLPPCSLAIIEFRVSWVNRENVWEGEWEWMKRRLRDRPQSVCERKETWHRPEDCNGNLYVCDTEHIS